MAVAAPARNYMPVQVRHHVAQRRQIDLVRCQHRLLRFFHRIHGAHQQIAPVRGQAGHFRQVGVPDHTREAGIVSIAHFDHAQVRATPQQRAAVFLAQGAVRVASAQAITLRY
ncbi:hypothetical protein G6F57_022085 [Rhizopus arrhizus]|nr:hypothetical protein G6F57_022085 [Rhizopus arrhizus]